ncbi:hypothetical protein PanWU01x14_138920 [Parasponia andersonii]|uniref:Uncharacterized protein n=1 Tax=Parasponia andersonii TaxID=3476 RepID=A0A2P5CMT6_PARAD|nr:hypothetical protein PanWU01x14_138920 [Parasponia andersonii]
MRGVLEKNLVLFFSLLPFPVKGIQLELSVRLLSYCIYVIILITVLTKTDTFNLYKVPTIHKTYLQPIALRRVKKLKKCPQIKLLEISTEMNSPMFRQKCTIVIAAVLRIQILRSG